MKNKIKGDQAFQGFLEYDFKTVLDLGSGKGDHAQALRAYGRQVTTVSLKAPADCISDYMFFNAGPFEAIWCCHVLEHQPNTNLFLRKIFNDLKDDGILALTVPPSKDFLVGGHLSIWNAGLLIYNLVLAGFDCSAARVGQYGYNISVIVIKNKADLSDLAMARGDLEKLACYFPVKSYQSMDANFTCNW